MKKLTAIVFSLLITALFGIEVSGNQSGTWTTANNPYQIVGDITVQSGTTLEIEEGVIVQAMGDYQITAEGSMIAIGTESSPITFSSATQSIWGGIRLDNDQTDNQFTYCEIQHAEYGLNISETQVSVTYCHFNNNEKAIQVIALGNNNPPTATITNNFIENCQQNGILIVESNPYIAQNEITQCALDGTARAGIQLSNQSTGGLCAPTIENNHIHNNVWQGITAWDVFQSGTIAPTVIGNLIEENLTGVYLYDASGFFADNVIRNNFVPGNSNSGAGVMLYGPTTAPTFTRNIITGNFCGFYIISGASADLGNIQDGDPENDGRNFIYGNIDESGTTYSVYSGSTQDIMAQNNLWDSDIASEIESTIIEGSSGEVIYDPLYGDTAVAFIMGSVPETTGTVVPKLLDPETLFTVAEGQLMDDGGYFLQVPYAGDFLVVLFETLNGETSYGIYGGHLDPTILSIEEETITPHIDIEEYVNNLSFEIEVLAPFTYEGDEIYPVEVSRNFMYHHRVLTVLGGEGIRMAGFVTYENNIVDTLWIEQAAWFVRNDNPQVGDTWPSAELIGDDIVITEATVTPYGNDEFLIVDYRVENILVAERCFFLGTGMSWQKMYDDWTLDLYNQLYNSEVYGGDGYMPLQEGNRWYYTDDPLPQNPENLVYFHQYDNVYRFIWDPPSGTGNQNWLSYKLYEDGVVAEIIAFGEPMLDYEVPGGTHEYYVTAVHETGESSPSNLVVIDLQDIGNDPEPVQQLSLDIYPNPLNLSSASGMSFSIASQQAPTVSIYNVKGQKIRSWTPTKDVSGRYMIRWNGDDQSGKTVASGIYLTRVQSSKNTVIKKVILLR